ncbi:MAG: hypothetical protein IPO06_19255 [Leptospiraceae bacterium]|nr:hypothetical protein [Leptospiraceae bacterium]
MDVIVDKETILDELGYNSFLNKNLYILLSGASEDLPCVNLLFIILLDHNNSGFSRIELENLLKEKYLYKVDSLSNSIESLDKQGFILHNANKYFLNDAVYRSHKNNYDNYKKEANHQYQTIRNNIIQKEILEGFGDQASQWESFHELILTLVCLLAYKLNQTDKKEDFKSIVKSINLHCKTYQIEKTVEWISYLDSNFQKEFSLFLSSHLKACLYLMKCERTKLKLDFKNTSNYYPLIIRAFLVILNSYSSLKNLENSLVATVNDLLLSWIDKSLKEQVELESVVSYQMQTLESDLKNRLNEYHQSDAKTMEQLTAKVDERVHKIETIEKHYNKLLVEFSSVRKEKERDRKIKKLEGDWKKTKDSLARKSEQYHKKEQSKYLKILGLSSLSCLYLVFVLMLFFIPDFKSLLESLFPHTLLSVFLYALTPIMIILAIFTLPNMLTNIYKHKRFDYANALADEIYKEKEKESIKLYEFYGQAIQMELSQLTPEEASAIAPVYHIYGGTNVISETINNLTQNGVKEE